MPRGVEHNPSLGSVTHLASRHQFLITLWKYVEGLRTGQSQGRGLETSESFSLEKGTIWPHPNQQLFSGTSPLRWAHSCILDMGWSVVWLYLLAEWVPGGPQMSSEARSAVTENRI